MARSRILTHPRFSGVAQWDSARRELSAVRDITRVLLNADAPEEVLQFALDRVSPLIGASFASVYLVEGVSELMRLGAAYNWPEQHRPWLGGMRVRLGFGPSGEAASERRVIEVPDVTADKDLEDWAEVAKELGFRSLVALPLQSAAGVLGTLTFYFRDGGLPDDDRRSLMRVVADQLAMAAEKSRLNEELRRTAAALGDARDEVEQQYRRVVQAGRARDTFMEGIATALAAPLAQLAELVASLHQSSFPGDTNAQAHEQISAELSRAKAVFEDLMELSAIAGGASEVSVDEFSPASSISVALSIAGAPPKGFVVRVDQLSELTPTARSDRQKYSRLLVTLFRHVYRRARAGEMAISLEVTSSHVRYVLRCRGVGDAGTAFWEEVPGLLLVRALATSLGGSVEYRTDDAAGVPQLSGERVGEGEGEGEVHAICEVELPLEYLPDSTRA